MKVLVGKFGEEVQEVDLSENATVGDALRAANITRGNQLMTVNGTSVDESSRLCANDYLLIKPAVKGA
jgi:sulfur carrier protein ThiS